MTTRTTAAEAPAAPQSSRFTAADAVTVWEVRERTHDFALDATMPGKTAQVRVPDLGDPDVLMGLPTPLLEQIMRYTREVETAEGRPQPAPAAPEPFDIERVRKDAERNRALIDAYCLAGFVDPPLIYSDKERTEDDQVVISVIHPSDRMRFFQWANGQHTEAAATVAPFPDGGDPGVATGGRSGSSRRSPKRPASAA